MCVCAQEIDIIEQDAWMHSQRLTHPEPTYAQYSIYIVETRVWREMIYYVWAFE